MPDKHEVDGSSPFIPTIFLYKTTIYSVATAHCNTIFIYIIIKSGCRCCVQCCVQSCVQKWGINIIYNIIFSDCVIQNKFSASKTHFFRILTVFLSKYP